MKSSVAFLFLALASLRLEAADDPAAIAGAVTGNDNASDLCDWSEGHVVYSSDVKPPTADEQAQQFKKILLKMAKRLVEVQQKTPDPHIKAIIDQSHLNDTAALSALPPEQARQAVVRTAMSLLEAAKTDMLALHLTQEFQINFKTSSPPAAPPSTNAPPAVAT